MSLPVPVGRGTLYQKACRCRGRSRGFFVFAGQDVPVVLGYLMGLPVTVACEKCGKQWRKVEKPAKRRRR